jgi:hypothetical protein
MKMLQFLPQKHPELGQLISIDGSLVDAVLSMTWADYRRGAKKAKTHIGFDINRGIPRKIFLTAGKGSERPFVSKILAPGETGVLDRGYQSHNNFDILQEDGKHFVCRIKENTLKTCLETYPVSASGPVFFDAKVLLGQQGRLPISTNSVGISRRSLPGGSDTSKCITSSQEANTA